MEWVAVFYRSSGIVSQGTGAECGGRGSTAVHLGYGGERAKARTVRIGKGLVGG